MACVHPAGEIAGQEKALLFSCHFVYFVVSIAFFRFNSPVLIPLSHQVAWLVLFCVIRVSRGFKLFVFYAFFCG
jgi:hypothetical protein